MQHIVLVMDVSIAMAMRDLFDPARGVALGVAAGVDRSPDHRLAAVIAVSSRARLTSVAELTDMRCDMEYGIDLDGALDLARHELGDRDGRVVLVSSLDFHHRHADGNRIAIVTPESLAEGRRTLEEWLGGGLQIDLLLCSSDQGRVHGERVRAICAEHGAPIVDLERGSELLERYLGALAS